MKAGAVKACKQRGKHCSAASHRPFLACCTTSKKEKKRKTRVFLFPLLEDNVMLLFFFSSTMQLCLFLFHNKHLSPLINEKPTTLPVLRTTLSFFFLFFFRSLVFSFPVFFFFWFIFHRGIECWPEGLCTFFLPADLHRTTDRAVRVRQPLLRMNQMCVLENGRRCYCTLRYVSQPLLFRIIFYNGKKMNKKVAARTNRFCLFFCFFFFWHFYSFVL